MINRPAYIIGLLLSVFLFLTACGKKEQINLVLLHSLAPNSSRVDYQMLAKYVGDFTLKNDHINIKLEYKQFKEIEALSRHPERVNPSEYPDILLLPHDQIGKLAQMKIIQPIDKIMKPISDKFFSNALKAVTFKKKMYGFPIHGETLVMVNNQDFVKNPPETVADLLKYKRKNEPALVKHSLLYTYFIPYFGLPWVFAYGGRIFDDNGYPRINEPATVRAFEKYANLVLNKLAIPRSSSTTFYRNTFLKKQAAFFITGPWMFSKLKENRINFSFSLLPKVENGKYVIPFVGYKIFVVFTQKNNKAVNAIEQFFKYLMETNFYVDYCELSNKTPALKKAYNHPRIKNNPKIQVFKKQIEKGIPMSNSPVMSIIWSYLNEDNFHKVLRSPNKKAILDKIQKLMDAQIKKMKMK